MAVFLLELDNVIDGVPRGIRFVKGYSRLCVLGQPQPDSLEECKGIKAHIVLLDLSQPHNVTRIEVDQDYVYGFDVSPSGNIIAVYGNRGIDVIGLAVKSHQVVNSS